jgi:hypothetical protein
MTSTHNGISSYKLSMNHKMKKKHFTQMQKGDCKDVKKAFGILQSKWLDFIKSPYRLWEITT